MNIGSEEMVTIDELAMVTAEVSGKNIRLKHIKRPLGVRGRNSDNHLIKEKLGWAPSQPLKIGIAITYKWIEEQMIK
jgi:GDP-D-mannose 3',5'-epimerase